MVLAVEDVRPGERDADRPDEVAKTRLAAAFDRHQARLFRLARRLAGSHEAARDLVQEAFLRVAARPGGLPADLDSEEAWLVRVLVNVARNEWRVGRGRRNLEARHLQEAMTRPAASPEAEVVARRTVWQAMEQLPPRRRAVVVLHELEGVPAARIAELLGVSAVTVRWHLAAGRRHLARIIKPGKTS